MPEQQCLAFRHRFPTSRQPNELNAGGFLRFFFRFLRFFASAASRRVASTSGARRVRALRRVDQRPRTIVRASKRRVSKA